VPTDAPKNISWRFQTPDVVEIVYDPPPEHARNGQIVLYEIQFSVRGNTRKGYGPWSTQQTFRTDRNIVRAPLGVKAMATSDSSLEVSVM
jgi:netrin-G3 ligand